MSAYKVTINGNLEIYYVEADDIQTAATLAVTRASVDYGTKDEPIEFYASRVKLIHGVCIGNDK